MSAGLARLLVAAIAALAIACGKSTPPGAAVTSPGTSGAGAPEGSDGGAAVEPMGPREAAAWAEADGGDAEELMRLADLVGCTGLRERGADAALRAVAIRAMAYCPDFGELPWLARIAADGSDADAVAALDSVIELAARPRRATDPEDAEELHAGCAGLLALARATDRPRERRVRAIRSLRMLSERGCVKRAEIPTDLDAK
jgi:hypothetical protein